MSRIVIGVPVNKDYVIDVRTAAYCFTESSPDNVTWGYVASREAGVGRSTFAYYALQDPEVTHLYFMDSDVVPPNGTLQRLLAHDVPIVAGIYPMLTSEPVWSFKAGTNRCSEGWCKRNALFPDGLIKVNAIGGSTLLVKREVFESFERPWFKIVYKAIDKNGKCYDYGEDEYFSKRVIEAGYDIMVDPSIVCAHYNYKEL